MHFVYPEAFLLLPLLALVLRGRLWPRPLLGVLRIAIVLAIAAILSLPSFGDVEDGRDVVLVVDRSRSMPDGSVTGARELADQIADELRDGDRIGIVTFGRGPVVVSAPSAELRWPDAVTAVDPDGSDLAAGLSAALALVQVGRQATLLVWSDGEVTGYPPMAVARLAQRRSVRIDVEPVPRAFGLDAAVGDVRVPGEVAIEAPFAINATVLATAAGRATWYLMVDGERLRQGQIDLQQGRNVVQLQHRLTEPGEHLIALEVQLPGDAVQQNDRGLAVLRGTARTRVLCVTPAGREDRLTRSLRAVGIELVVAAPEIAPLTLAALDGFRAVVLEDVAASQLPPGGMRALATWVRDLGGGLMMTGGQHSFGVGGYHRSPIEDVLPVTMEIREEQRRFGLAMAIALDRSGSMAASAGGTTKMQLANRGAASAIELLSPIDAVTVFAVDTSAHVVQPLQAVEDVEAIVTLVRSIESGGGGIYLGEALHAAAEQLAEATQTSRHIVLFADADDAEEPTDYQTFVPELVADGYSVSVIGLGDSGGRDAQLLEEIAALGGGRCQFVADAVELPRVFAQETIQVARSSQVEQSTDVIVEPPLQLLGSMPAEVPPLGGYSVAWLRERADRDLLAADEHDAPLLAHWQSGLGRAVAFLGEADGELSGAWADWDGYADFFGTLVRWLAGGSANGVFVEARRDGDVGIYTLEVEAERQGLLDRARGVRTAPDGTTVDLVLRSVAPARVEIRVPLDAEGVHRAAVQFGDETVRLPPLCRPYSAEWALQTDARAGERTLRRLARRTGGAVSPSAADVLSGPRQSLGRHDLGPWSALMALLLLLLEIAMRRLQVHLPVPWRRRARAVTPTRADASAAEGQDGAGGKGMTEAAPAGDLLGALERAHRRGKRRV